MQAVRVHDPTALITRKKNVGCSVRRRVGDQKIQVSSTVPLLDCFAHIELSSIVLRCCIRRIFKLNHRIVISDQTSGQSSLLHPRHASLKHPSIESSVRLGGSVLLTEAALQIIGRLCICRPRV
jgi:hypothetical protein